MVELSVRPYKVGPFVDGYLTYYQVTTKVNGVVRASTVLDNFTMGHYRWLIGYARRHYL